MSLTKEDGAVGAVDVASVTRRYKAEDAQSHAARLRLLRKMKALRCINESLADWTEQCNAEWKNLDREDEARLAEREEWHARNAEKCIGSGFEDVQVPSMKTFASRVKTGQRTPLAQKPEWFDVMGISAKASQLAWKSAVEGECNVDVSSPGGIAVSNLFDMLVAARDHSSSSSSSSFDWDAHSYSAKDAKQAIEAALEAAVDDENDVGMFYQHESDIEAYKKALSATPGSIGSFVGSASNATASMLATASARMAQMSVQSSNLKQPSATTGWWSSSSPSSSSATSSTWMSSSKQ